MPKSNVSKDMKSLFNASSRVIRLMETNSKSIFILRDVLVGEGSTAVLAVVCGDDAENFFNCVKKSKAYKSRKLKLKNTK
jgi:hypothetical protein